MSADAARALGSAPSPSAFVLAGRPLRPGTQLADTSRFSDDVWRMKPAILQVQERTVVFDFLTLPQRFRPATRRLFYSLLCQDLEPPTGEKHGAIASVRTAFGDIKRFLIWLDARWPAHLRELSAITPADLDAYNRHLLKILPRSRGAREAARVAVRLLWRWRIHLGADRLQFDPLHLDGWGEDRPRRDRENRTDRLPEDVLGPCWSGRCDSSTGLRTFSKQTASGVPSAPAAAAPCLATASTNASKTSWTVTSRNAGRYRGMKGNRM